MFYKEMIDQYVSVENSLVRFFATPVSARPVLHSTLGEPISVFPDCCPSVSSTISLGGLRMVEGQSETQWLFGRQVSFMIESVLEMVILRFRGSQGCSVLDKN